MKKLCLYLFLLCMLPGAAAVVQDSIVFKEVTLLQAKNLPYEHRNFREGFKEDYSGTDYEYDPKIEKEKTRWDRFKEWLALWLQRLFNTAPQGEKISGLAIAARVFAFLLLGVAVYFIARAVLNKQGYWIFGKANRKITAHDAGEENIHEMDFAALVNETRLAGNYRLAIRYYYLWLLKKLSGREVIELHRDKTNSDYLYEIRDKGLQNDFRYLSYLYDHSWYGEFTLDAAAFEKAERAFRKTLNVL